MELPVPPIHTTGAPGPLIISDQSIMVQLCACLSALEALQEGMLPARMAAYMGMLTKVCDHQGAGSIPVVSASLCGEFGAAKRLLSIATRIKLSQTCLLNVSTGMDSFGLMILFQAVTIFAVRM